MTAATAEDRTPRTARGRETLRRLLDAAEQEFGERGYHEAAITGITQRAGIALGSFYTYFTSKDEAYRALVRDMSVRVRRHLSEALAGTGGDRLAVEERGIAAYIDYVRAHPNLYRIIEESQFVAEDAYRAHYDSFATAYREGLQAAATNGEIVAGPDEVRAWALIGVSVFLGMRFGMWSVDRPAAELAAEAGTLIADGLRPRR
jgi:AcrR family transcriptional regulator